MKNLLLALSLLAASLSAHEGHHESGTFEPPHGGAFAKLADHWIEFYLEGGKAFLCMYESDGTLTEDEHVPKNIAVKLSGKGVKAATLKSDTAKQGCASWAYSSKAKLIRVEVSALVDGKPAKAKLALENKPKPAAAAPAAFICSMDGHKSDKPGKCPKCGMALVAAKP